MLFMGKGISIKGTTIRSLAYNDDVLVQGGESNRLGLYTKGNDLLLDGRAIATSSSPLGLRVVDGELYFGNSKIGGETPPEPPTPTQQLWIPPTQEVPSWYKERGNTYADMIAKYDALMAQYPTYITKGTYSEQGYGDYNLYHYVLTPENYTKTFYVQACIHGNEVDGPLMLYHIVEILCNHTNENAYRRLKPLRDNVRFVIIPIVSPWGFDNHSMDLPFVNWAGESTTMNPNRNLDFNHQYGLDRGRAGNYPWQIAETRHIKSVVESIGVKNIDYLVDFHDGARVPKHFWFNYNMDGANATVMQQLLADLIDYEEQLRIARGTDYRQFEDETADELGYVHPNVADASGYSTGTSAGWFNTTLGNLGSVCEYISGYWGEDGYSFNSEQMTRSLRIRANLLIYAYEMLDTKGWLVNEPQDAEYFHFDYPIAMTRQGLRRDATDTTTSHTKVTIDDVYDRWDALVSAYPSYVTKSASLGQNNDGVDIYSYTLGNGSKKVLFLGGALRWVVKHNETEFGMYVLAEYLCNNYIVSQSAFLQNLKQNYTIVVLPCIDFTPGSNTASGHGKGLNSSAMPTSHYNKWQIVNDKCQPTTYGSNSDVFNVFSTFLTAHTDALMILSGGEDTTGWATELPKYNQDYMTQIILPMNQTLPQVVQDYLDHLENDRGEDAADVDHTTGMTFGDYAYDNYGIPTIYLNMKVSQKWEERMWMAQDNDDADRYFYRNYETGRRIANIANLFLCY